MAVAQEVSLQCRLNQTQIAAYILNYITLYRILMFSTSKLLFSIGYFNKAIEAAFTKNDIYVNFMPRSLQVAFNSLRNLKKGNIDLTFITLFKI